MSKRQQMAKLLHRTGALRALDWFWGAQRLTVLAYHRIDDPASPDFFGYESVVSATPAMFARQMAFVADNFNVIDLDALHAYVVDGKPLPPKPLLITFDDGYLDNYIHAFPVLRQHGFPAVVFLVTDRMDNPAPLWWDVCASYFRRTAKTKVILPLLGEQELSTDRHKKQVLDTLMGRLKRLPNTEKVAILPQIAESLDFDPESDYPSLFASWEQIREMAAGGIRFQPHTVDHPILTRVSDAEAYRQIAESKARVEAETGQRASAFAYPNGTLGDYTQSSLKILRDLDFTTAFTLVPGPMHVNEVRSHPLQIKRVYLGHRDTFDLFVMKIMGVPALSTRGAYLKD